MHTHFVRFTAFQRFCGKVYRNFRTLLRSKENGVPEKWSVLLDGIEPKGVHPVHSHLSFDANDDVAGRERSITMSAHSP